MKNQSTGTILKADTGGNHEAFVSYHFFVISFTNLENRLSQKTSITGEDFLTVVGSDGITLYDYNGSDSTLVKLGGLAASLN